MEISFQVIGRPATQGSKKAVPIYSKAGPVMKDGRVLTRVIDDCKRLATWRQEVAHAARQAYSGPLLTVAIDLYVAFEIARPKCHYGTGKNAGIVKPSAPTYPIGKPDLLKLVRAIEDSLTGVIYRNDSQVIFESLSKAYGQFHSVTVRIATREEWEIEADP